MKYKVIIYKQLRKILCALNNWKFNVDIDIMHSEWYSSLLYLVFCMVHASFMILLNRLLCLIKSFFPLFFIFMVLSVCHFIFFKKDKNVEFDMFFFKCALIFIELLCKFQNDSTYTNNKGDESPWAFSFNV